MLILRKVAIAASAGWIKSNDFNAFWPIDDNEKDLKPSWGATSLELRKKLMEKFKK